MIVTKKLFPITRSTNLRGARYINGDVVIQFMNGSMYIYRGVPWRLYRGMRRAVSQGRYFNRNIKGLFPYEKLIP